MKNYVLLLLLVSTIGFAQHHKKQKLGQATNEELKMMFYEKDSLAKALVLFEKANVYIDKSNDYNFRTDIYKRIKIFDKSELKKGTVSFYLRNKEKVKNINAVTNNLVNNVKRKVFLTDDKIFEKQVNENWKEITFTLPEVKEGSVIEYQYSIISPYHKIRDWYFQSNIPKVKSAFNFSILGNWKYNSRLIGYEKLDKDTVYIKKNCLFIPSIGDGACAVYDYQMNDIPAFKEEKHMLSKENYLSRLIFDAISFTSTKGIVTNYTKTWKDADKTMRTQFLDKQTSKKSYFKKNLPNHIFSISEDLEKAKAVYKHIQDKLFWNGDYWTRKNNVKDVYKTKKGSVDGINLVLYNALKAADIESYLVMSSTRNNGLPTKLYPIVSDFNYVLVKAVINGKFYFLDATDKQLHFGEIPFKCLNGDGRVLDFKKGSYWQTLKSIKKSSYRLSKSLKLEEDGSLKGNVLFKTKGYYALNTRKLIYKKSEEDYLDYLESKYPNIAVDSFSIIENNEKALSINYDLTVEDASIDDGHTIKLNPFIIERFTENPFKLSNRKYAVDFGYPKTISQVIKIEIPENYTVKNAIKKQALSLPNKGGRFIINSSFNGKVINIFFTFSLNKKIYSNQEYYYIKELYNKIINTQKSYITLIKKNSTYEK